MVIKALSNPYTYISISSSLSTEVCSRSNILRGQKYGNDGPRRHRNAAVCQSCLKQFLRACVDQFVCLFVNLF